MKTARYWLIAFAFAYLIWLVHDDSAKLPELLAGAVVAALAATGTELVRRQRLAGIALRPRQLRSVWRLIPSAARDCVTLTRAAFAQVFDRRPLRGRAVAVPFGYGDEAPPANARRALALGLGSFAPGTIVVGVDHETGLLIAHQLPASGDPGDLDPLELR